MSTRKKKLKKKVEEKAKGSSDQVGNVLSHGAHSKNAGSFPDPPWSHLGVLFLFFLKRVTYYYTHTLKCKYKRLF